MSDEQDQEQPQPAPALPEWAAQVQDDIERMRLNTALDNPEFVESIQGMDVAELDQTFTEMWRANYPGAMLCGAAHFAMEVHRMGELADQAGAGPLAFIAGVKQLVYGVLTAHVGHHDTIVDSTLRQN